MKKIPSLYLRDPNDMAHVTREVNERRALNAESDRLSDIDGVTVADVEGSGVLRGLASLWSTHPDCRQEWGS